MPGFFELLRELNWEYHVEDLRKQLGQLRDIHRQTDWDLQDLKALAAENVELKLRLGLLVQLLISKGMITAEEYARLIAEATREQ